MYDVGCHAEIVQRAEAMLRLPNLLLMLLPWTLWTHNVSKTQTGNSPSISMYVLYIQSTVYNTLSLYISIYICIDACTFCFSQWWRRSWSKWSGMIIFVQWRRWWEPAHWGAKTYWVVLNGGRSVFCQNALPHVLCQNALPQTSLNLLVKSSFT